MLEIGQIAPDFCANNQDDVKICLKDLKEKWIVLYFYPKDLTPGCTTQACDFTQTMPQFDNLNATILGVSPDDRAKHRKFIKKHNLSITLLSDTQKKMCKDYDIWKPKKFMGREFLGVIRSTFIINPKGEIAAIWTNVKVRKKRSVKGEKIEILHVNEVREKLQELQSN